MISVCFIVDPLENLMVKKDTTLALMLEAQRRGWLVQISEHSELMFRQGRVYARMRPLQLIDISGAEKYWYETQEPIVQPLAAADLVMMRKDPPFDMDYIYATYLLECAEKEGALVVNKPQSLRDCNEKFFATAFPNCVPPLLVSADKDVIAEFHEQQGDIVVKPLDGMGGEGVFRLQPDDKNRNVIIDTLTLKGHRQIMAQLFLPEISQGDKRIIIVDGTVVPYALARMPLAGENRANLAAGGIGVARPLTERDRWIAQQTGPTLKRLGLLFVGLDVIGDYLTEVNVTCPTGIRELDAQCDLNIARDLFDSIENRLVDR